MAPFIPKSVASAMSAIPPKADIDRCDCHVRFVSIANIAFFSFRDAPLRLGGSS